MPKPKRRGNGQGSVYKRGNTYQVETCKYIQGYRFRQYKGGFRTKREAYEFLANNGFDTPAVTTLSELYAEWFPRWSNTVTSGRSDIVARYWQSMKKLAVRDIASLTYDDLQRFVDKYKEWTPAMNVKFILTSCYTLAIKKGIVTSNIGNLISLPERHHKDTKQIFTESEIDIMWAPLKSDSFMAYPLIMIYTGMRPNELLKLRKENIDIRQNILTGIGSKTEIGKSTPIVFPDKIKPLLTAYEPCGISNSNLFAHHFRSHMKKNGIRPLPPYSCRHTCASLLTKKGAQPAVIQQIMRHSSYRTTLNYTHIDNMDTLTAVNQL